MGRTSKQIKATGKRHTEFFRYACLHRSGRIVFHMTGQDPARFEENDDILHWWKLDLDSHVDKYEFVQTAWFAGADIAQLKIIAFSYWGLNDLDCLAYIQSSGGLIAGRFGSTWRVHDERREFDPNSPEGKGPALLLALIDYRIKAAKKENERATKTVTNAGN